MRSLSSPKRGCSRPMSTPCVSTAQAPTNAKKKALEGASHPKRALEKSGKLVSSPANERFSKKTASKNHRMLRMPRTPRNCDRGLRRRSGVGVRSLAGRDSGRTRKPNVALARASAEAVKAGAWASRGSGGRPGPGRPSARGRRRLRSGRVPSRGARERCCPLCRPGRSPGCRPRLRRARPPRRARRSSRPGRAGGRPGTRRAGRPRGPGGAPCGRRGPRGRVRRRTALRRRASRAGRRARPRSVLPRVEGEEWYDETVTDHVHEDRDEDKQQRRPAELATGR